MTFLSFHHKPSSDPDVDSVGAIETLADLSTGITYNSEEEEGSRDGSLVKITVECETDEAGGEFIQTLRRFGLLY